VVEALDVEEEREARADAGVAQRRDVALDEGDVDARLPGALPRLPDRLGDDVDADDLPAAPREFDRPPAGAAPEVERGAVRRLARRLLARDERAELGSQRRRVLLPGSEAHAVGEPVPATHGPSSADRIAIQTKSVPDLLRL
jgi:hypothetical protein